ncbi:hypothetical protein PAECIP111893_03840 [Paenibacillus plantiphilus]|uniref:Uncharacterized protein n=1 Tax=Paenibacillus plantiphilus TaxID=2905650 RepID=A0ABN8GPS6_9BACL|nr:hypothetical protein [Paenibacillus plantiphilus]CAH1214731.1 hypothetical protein PAECIP111893_03840 [Paenibacillus plantiphilus]
MKIIFRDAQHAWNPTQEEIKAWAYSGEKIPEQDWELAVNSLENIPMICSLIDDEKCNRTLFFLGSLYVFIGDIVRSGEAEEIGRLSELLNTMKMKAKSERLIDWIKRSKYLIQHPNTYDYDYWGLGSKHVY